MELPSTTRQDMANGPATETREEVRSSTSATLRLTYKPGPVLSNLPQAEPNTLHRTRTDQDT
jgi:hypothetical protein